MQKIVFAHIALFLANTIYAINYLYAKDVMEIGDISPTGFILLRVMGASILFFLIHFFFIKEKISKTDRLYLIICSVFGVVINMLCFFHGLDRTSEVNAALIMITTPLMVYIISCFLSREKWTVRRALGVLLGLFGAGFLILNSPKTVGGSSTMGDILVFVNAFSYAIYLIMIKSMMKKYHPLTVLKTIFLIGTIIILPFGWIDVPSVTDFSNMSLEVILKILFVILFTTCGAYFLNIFAVSYLRSSTVAFYIYLQPLLTTLFMIILGEDPFTMITVISAACIFTGVYFVIKRKKI